MENFLRSNNWSKYIDTFTDYGLDDETFFMLTDQDISTIFSSIPNMLECVKKKFLPNFISKLNEHKQTLYSQATCEKINIEFLRDDESMDISENSNLSDSASEPVASIDTSTTKATFEYIQNKLYLFLNHEDNIDGQLILNIYKKNGVLETERLIDLVILEAIKKDKIKWLISRTQFEEIRDLIIELFPSEDPDTYYVGHIRASDSSDKIHAHGKLINHYKYIRQRLTDAGFIKGAISRPLKKQKKVDCPELSVSDFPQCLTTDNQDQYSLDELIQSWNEYYFLRIKYLSVPDSLKLEKLSIYLNFFKCLRTENGLRLLELDFNKKVSDAIVKDQALSNVPFSKLFFENWYIYATKLITLYVSKKSSKKELKLFLEKNQVYLQNKDCQNVLALLGIPYYFKVNKCSKVESDKSKNLKGSTTEKSSEKSTSVSRKEILDSFILHVEDPEELDAKIDENNAKLIHFDHMVLPYVVITGPLDNLGDSYVIFQSKLFKFGNPLLAVQACFKSLYALNTWPYLSDFNWIFIAKMVYSFKVTTRFTSVTTAVSEIRKSMNA